MEWGSGVKEEGVVEWSERRVEWGSVVREGGVGEWSKGGWSRGVE